MENIKIIMLGDFGVGKSSLLIRYLKGVFKENLVNTYVDKYHQKINLKGQEISVEFWDTAGQEIFRSLIRSYYRIADGVLLVYSVNNLESCEKVQSWLSDFRSVNDSAKVVVVGNMSEDPEEKSESGINIVKRLVESENLDHAEVSAKTGENVEDIFHFLIQRILVDKGIFDFCTRPDCFSCNSSNTTGSPVKDIGNSVSNTVCKRRTTENKDLLESYKSLNTSVINLVDEIKNKETQNNKSSCWC